MLFFFFSSRRRHTRLQGDWSSDVCSSDLGAAALAIAGLVAWAFHAGGGRELLSLGSTPKPVEVANLAAPARLAGRPTVAVLPFKNLSGDAGQDFFSDGITEDVITALGRFSNLLVIAKSASFPFKGL